VPVSHGPGPGRPGEAGRNFDITRHKGIIMQCITSLSCNPTVINVNSNPVKISYSLIGIAGAIIKIEILSPANKPVYDIDVGYQAAGAYSAEWQGCDNNYFAVPDGAYTIKVTAIPVNYRAPRVRGLRQASKWSVPAEAIATDSTFVYVVDPVNNRLKKYDTGGNFIDETGPKGLKWLIKGPRGVAVSLDGKHVYVTKNNPPEVLMFTNDLAFVRKWDDPFGTNLNANDVSGITTDEDGDVYVLVECYPDEYLPGQPAVYQIYKYSRDGQYLAHSFDAAGAFCTDLAVCKYKKKRSGADFKSINVLFSMYDPSLNGQIDEVRIYDNSAVLNPLGSFGFHQLTIARVFPAGIDVDKNGIKYITDQGNDQVLLYTHDNRYIASFVNNRLIRPSGICIDKTGNIYINDSGNGRIVKYGPLKFTITDPPSSATTTVTMDNSPP
jgi:DNA-binding beta-propeller fold protein YncE